MGWAEANLAAAEGRWPEAWASFGQVVELLTRAGARWHLALVMRDWADAYLARGEAGDVVRARELLSKVKAAFEAMGSPFYARRVEKQLEDLSPRA
jgi:hypothetical protein